MQHTNKLLKKYIGSGKGGEIPVLEDWVRVRVTEFDRYIINKNDFYFPKLELFESEGDAQRAYEDVKRCLNTLRSEHAKKYNELIALIDAIDFAHGRLLSDFQEIDKNEIPTKRGVGKKLFVDFLKTLKGNNPHGIYFFFKKEIEREIEAFKYSKEYKKSRYYGFLVRLFEKEKEKVNQIISSNNDILTSIETNIFNQHKDAHKEVSGFVSETLGLEINACNTWIFDNTKLATFADNDKEADKDMLDKTKQTRVSINSDGSFKSGVNKIHVSDNTIYFLVLDEFSDTRVEFQSGSALEQIKHKRSLTEGIFPKLASIMSSQHKRNNAIRGLWERKGGVFIILLASGVLSSILFYLFRYKVRAKIPVSIIESPISITSVNIELIFYFACTVIVLLVIFSLFIFEARRAYRFNTTVIDFALQRSEFDDDAKEKIDKIQLTPFELHTKTYVIFISLIPVCAAILGYFGEYSPVSIAYKSQVKTGLEYIGRQGENYIFRSKEGEPVIYPRKNIDCMKFNSKDDDHNIEECSTNSVDLPDIALMTTETSRRPDVNTSVIRNENIFVTHDNASKKIIFHEFYSKNANGPDTLDIIKGLDDPTPASLYKRCLKKAGANQLHGICPNNDMLSRNISFIGDLGVGCSDGGKQKPVIKVVGMASSNLPKGWKKRDELVKFCSHVMAEMPEQSFLSNEPRSEKWFNLCVANTRANIVHAALEENLSPEKKENLEIEAPHQWYDYQKMEIRRHYNDRVEGVYKTIYQDVAQNLGRRVEIEFKSLGECEAKLID